MTGSGNVIVSRTTGFCGSQSVSPVVVSLRPANAMMSPAKASSISSRLFECIIIMRPTRSRLPFVEFMHRVALLHRSGIDPGEGQGSDEGVVHDLECKPRERLAVIGPTRDIARLGLVVRRKAHVGRHVERVRAGSR